MTGGGEKSPEGKKKDEAEAAGPRKAVPCPICSKMSVQAYFPFCSQRCRDVDLSRWLGGQYAIPARIDDDEDGLGVGEGSGDEADGEG